MGACRRGYHCEEGQRTPVRLSASSKRTKMRFRKNLQLEETPSGSLKKALPKRRYGWGSKRARAYCCCFSCGRCHRRMISLRVVLAERCLIGEQIGRFLSSDQAWHVESMMRRHEIVVKMTTRLASPRWRFPCGASFSVLLFVWQTQRSLFSSWSFRSRSITSLAPSSLHLRQVLRTYAR